MRGFDGLDNIEEIDLISSEDQEIELSILKPNPYQTRLQHTGINELSNSIEKHELLQKIVVNQDDIIVFGHRRVEAYKNLNRTHIKFERKYTTNIELYNLVHVENDEREDVTAIELALSYEKALKEKLFSSASLLAKSLNKSESHITKIRNMLKLPKKVQDDIIENNRKPSVETLNLLIKLDDQECVTDLYYKYIRNELNRAELKEQINKILHKPSISAGDPVKVKGNKLTVGFNLKHLDEDKKQNLENEINKILKKYEKEEV